MVFLKIYLVIMAVMLLARLFNAKKTESNYEGLCYASRFPQCPTCSHKQGMTDISNSSEISTFFPVESEFNNNHRTKNIFNDAELREHQEDMFRDSEFKDLSIEERLSGSSFIARRIREMQSSGINPFLPPPDTDAIEEERMQRIGLLVDEIFENRRDSGDSDDSSGME